MPNATLRINATETFNHTAEIYGSWTINRFWTKNFMVRHVSGEVLVSFDLDPLKA